MLTRGQVDAVRLPGVFEALDRSAQTQAQLIADVLDVSRIITGKLQLNTNIVNLCEIVAGAVEAVRPAALTKRIGLTVEQPSDCFVDADPRRLQQVFWNLLSNAIKFTPDGGSIRVEITPDPKTIAVAVTDSGIGIPREFVPFVFDRFRQADQTATRAHGGLGLGLSIVKHLTELHRGTVTASSPGLGAGARFEVRLPAVKGTRGLPDPEIPLSNRVALDGQAILIVDDDDSTREVVAAALEAAHARVQVASSATEARERLEQNTPALIIADLGMPEEDGLTFIRGVRQSAARRVPAIALSAYADQASREAALAAGFSAFLAKPTGSHVLLELVWTVLHDLEPR
jgi:CheY-like chemotaxis protein